MDEMERDPALAAALRGMDGDAPAMDWDALRARVTAQAELPLARRRRTLSIRRGFRAIVPLAAPRGSPPRFSGLAPSSSAHSACSATCRTPSIPSGARARPNSGFGLW